MTELLSCGQPHPEHDELVCAKAPHPYGAHMSRSGQVWPGLEAPAGTGSRATKVTRLAAMAQQCATEGRNQRVGAPGSAPEPVPAPEVGLYRASDPKTAQEAAERYQPARDSAKGRVLAYLQEHVGEWIDAPTLTHQSIGGFAGTRRMRELREAGWPIETRPKPGGTSNTWQHRLLPE